MIVNKDERLKIKTEENMQVILDVLSHYKNGLYATDIAYLTDLTLRQCARILSMLRAQGKVNQVNKRSEWILAPKQEPIYPNLDTEHEEWINAKKPRFNPWGQGNAAN